MAKSSTKKPKRKMSAQQKKNAKASANRHGRSKPGLWENVNASKGKGPKAGDKKKSKPKGKTRPGKRSKGKSKSKAKSKKT